MCIIGQTYEISLRSMLYTDMHQAIIIGNAQQIYEREDYDSGKYGVLLFKDDYSDMGTPRSWFREIEFATLICSNELRGLKILIKNINHIRLHFGSSSCCYLDKLRLNMMKLQFP